jgi:hypothetical protein
MWVELSIMQTGRRDPQSLLENPTVRRSVLGGFRGQGASLRQCWAKEGGATDIENRWPRRGEAS